MSMRVNSTCALIKKRNTPENGTHDVAKVAPDQAKNEWLRAISDTEPLHTLHRRATRSARRACVQSIRSASVG